MAAVITNNTKSPAISYLEVDQVDYSEIFSFIENKGLNNLFPAFGIIKAIEGLELVEYNREYEATLLRLPIIFKFSKTDTSWLWEIIIGPKTYSCKLKEERYRELLDRIHNRIEI